MIVSRSKVVLLGGLAALGVCASSLAKVPTAATVTYVEAAADRRGVIQGDRLRGLYGTVLDIDSNPGTTTQDFVDAFLGLNANAFGVNGVVLELKGTANTSNDKYEVFTYTQKIEDLPVYGSVVKIPVLQGATEKIGHVGIHLVQPPAEALPSQNEINAEAAITVVSGSSKYGHLDSFDDPEDAQKMIVEGDDDTLHRAWSFTGWSDDDPEGYRFFVNTTSEEIVRAVNQILDGDVQVTVTGMATSESSTSAPDPTTTESAALGGIEIRRFSDADSYCPPSFYTLEEDVFADENGVYTFTDVILPAWVTSQLWGEWVVVTDFQGAQYGWPSTIRTECDSVSQQFDPVSLFFDQDPNELYGPAAVNAFLVTQKTHNWMAALLEDSTPIDLNVRADVNATPNDPRLECNAFYSPVPSWPRISFMITTDPTLPCWGKNSAFSTIIAHEYGHFILDRLVGLPTGIIDPVMGEVMQEFHEGAADTVAALLWGTSCLAEDWLDNGCDCVRNVDAMGAQCNYRGFLTEDCAPDGCEVQLFDTRCDVGLWSPHCGGMALSGAFWDLREAFITTYGEQGGVQKVNQLFADFLLLTRGILDHVVVMEVLIADDDDADLASTPPTPNYQAILDSFVGNHGWWDPLIPVEGDGRIKVGWFGPSEGPDEADDDFAVYYNFTPPYVVLKSTQKGAPGYEIPVEEWYIGCELEGEPCHVGTVYADWVGPAYDVLVDVGGQDGFPCTSLNVVDIPRQHSSTYSDLELDVPQIVWGRAECQANDSRAGGRVSGSVGLALNVRAEAIGVGADGGGQLTALALANSTFNSFPADAKLVADNVLGLTINEEFAGLIDVGVHTYRTIDIRGTGMSTGDILVDGDIDGPPGGGYAIRIAGDMSGDILADADFDGVGDLGSWDYIWIAGEFTGDHCTASLDPGADPPHYFHAETFSGTICRVRAPIGPPEPHGGRKNRYLSINPRTNHSAVAIQVTLESMKRCNGLLSWSCDSDTECPSVCYGDPTKTCTLDSQCGADGPCNVETKPCVEHPHVGSVVGWVGVPFQVPDGCNPQACGDEDWITRVMPDPVYRTWTKNLLHVGDCEIVPVATYALRSTPDGIVFSDPLIIGTIRKPDINHYADVAGPVDGETGEYTPPDGYVNVVDVMAYLHTVKNYPSASPYVHRTWVDLHGLCEGNAPNYIPNVSDLQRILFGIKGDTYTVTEDHEDPGDCPDVGCRSGVGQNVTISLESSTDIIDAGEPVEIDAYIDSVGDLGAFELALEVSGGTAGELTLTAITVDSGRQDYVFGSATAYNAKNMSKGSLSNALANGSVQVTGPGYLATFTYQPTGGASGVFTITVKGDEDSFLNKGDGVMLATQTGATEVIGVGIDCFDVGDCATIACQTAACTNYECIYTDIAQGTPCDDGQYCTATDECDGNGTCVGSGATCSIPLKCCELLNDCVCRTCPCLPPP